MAKNLKEALERNRRAAEDLDKALRDCLHALRTDPEPVVERRFVVVNGGRRRSAGGPATHTRM